MSESPRRGWRPQRLPAALEMRFVIGFEHGPAYKPVRDLASA